MCRTYSPYMIQGGYYIRELAHEENIHLASLSLVSKIKNISFIFLHFVPQKLKK